MWTELIENPKAITAIFSAIPSLDQVQLLRITLSRDGPTVDLAIALNEYPENPSPRWEKSQSNAVVLEIQLMGISALSIEGWSLDNVVTLKLERRESGQLQLEAIDSTLRFKCNFGWLRITGVTPYHRV